MRSLLLLILFVVPLAFATVPDKIYVDRNLTFSNDVFPGSTVAIDFAAPDYVLVFNNISGKVNFTVNGSGTIVFNNSSIAAQGVFLSYVDDRDTGLPLTIIFNNSSLVNATAPSTVIESSYPVNVLIFDSNVLLSASGGGLYGDLMVERSKVRFVGGVGRVRTLHIQNSYLSGTFTDGGVIGYIGGVLNGPAYISKSQFYWVNLNLGAAAEVKDSIFTSSSLTVADGSEIRGNVFDIEVPITVGGSVKPPAIAIRATLSNDGLVVLENNKVSAYRTGLSARDCRGKVVLLNNTFNATQTGADVCGNIAIEGNTFVGQATTAGDVGLNYYNAEGYVRENTFTGLERGIQAFQTISICYGFSPLFCVATHSNVSVCNNTFNVTTYALYLYETQIGEICDNDIEDSAVGLVLWDPVGLEVRGNKIENGVVGIALASKDGEGKVYITSNVLRNLEVAYGPAVIYKDGKPSQYLSFNNTFENVTKVVALYYTTALASSGGGGGPSPSPISVQPTTTTSSTSSSPSTVSTAPVSLPTSPTSPSTGTRPLNPYPTPPTPSAASPMERVLEDLSQAAGSNTILTYKYSEPVDTTVKEMSLNGDAIYLPDVVVTANDSSNGSFKLKIDNTLVYGDNSGILFQDSSVDSEKLADIIRNAADTGSIYLGEGIISIDTATEPALAGLNAILYFKVPSCSYIFRVWFTDTFTRSSDDVKALGRLLTTPTQCSYDERMQSYVLKVPVTIE